MISFQRLLSRRSDQVQYYQWILGSMCQGNESLLLLTFVSKCNTETELKSLINQPIEMGAEIDTEFGTDGALITYSEVS